MVVCFDCEEVDFAEVFELIDNLVEEPILWLIEDEVCVESEDVFVILLVEEVDIRAGHNRGGLES